ncbi:MAG: hypothetical protein RIU46_38990 [Deltaproteobacteria bacterium]|jgi:hypothetical protein
MKSLKEIAAVEARYSSPQGLPTLGDAYDMLLERWELGARDLETGLRLLFLAWYTAAEPPTLTGLRDDASTIETIRDVFGFFGGVATSEPELIAAVGLMATIAPHAFGGQEDEWIPIAASFIERGPRIGHELPPEHFHGRGAMGDYLAHHAANPVYLSGATLMRAVQQHAQD